MDQATIGTAMELGYLIDLELETNREWSGWSIMFSSVFYGYNMRADQNSVKVLTTSQMISTLLHHLYKRMGIPTEPETLHLPSWLYPTHSLQRLGNAFQKYATPLSKPLTTAVATPGLCCGMKSLGIPWKEEKQKLEVYHHRGRIFGVCSAKEACPGLKAEAFWSLMKFDKKKGRTKISCMKYITCKCDMPQWPTGFAYSRSVAKRDGDPGLRSSAPPDSRKVLQDCVAYVLHSGFYWSLILWKWDVV